jgi:hypothetical protein
VHSSRILLTKPILRKSQRQQDPQPYIETNLKKTGNLAKRIRIGKRTTKITLIKARISLSMALALIVRPLILIINIIAALKRKVIKREGKSRRKRKAGSGKAFIRLQRKKSLKSSIIRTITPTLV